MQRSQRRPLLLLTSVFALVVLSSLWADPLLDVLTGRTSGGAAFDYNEDGVVKQSCVSMPSMAYTPGTPARRQASSSACRRCGNT